MSRMAPFTDGARVDRTNLSITYTSYYSLGGAIALALDLTLRQRSDGTVSLDDFMSAMWRLHGKPGGAHEGDVDHPYTAEDVEARLAEVSGDTGFARDFFSRFIRGREAADYTALLARAGFAVRKRSPGRAWWGDVRLQQRSGRLVIAALVPINSPAYLAGLEKDDEIRMIDATTLRSPEDASAAMQRAKPGDRLRVAYVDRSGVDRTATVMLVEDPHLEVRPIEVDGGALTSSQRTFRDRWLSGR
jgi:predicted metalloprotease with PDZ domain